MSAEEEWHLKSALDSADAPQLFKEALESSAVQNRIGHDIGNLHNTTQEIQKIFSRVAGHLAEFDNARFQGRDGDVLKFGPQWEGYSQRFNKLLRKSQKNAVDAAAFLQQYDALLGCASQKSATLEDYAAVRDELKPFLKTLHEREALAEETRDNFTELAQDIRRFKESVDNTLRTAEGYLAAMLDAARTQVTELHAQLKGVSQKIPQFSVSEHVSLLVVGGAAAIAVSMLSPTSLVDALEYLVTKAKSDRDAKKEKRSFRRNFKAFMHKLTGTEVQSRETTHSGPIFDRDIGVLADKLEVIVGIWTSLSTDILNLEKQLELVVGSDTERVTRVFANKIGATRTVYNTLMTMLTLYAKGCPIDLP